MKKKNILLPVIAVIVLIIGVGGFTAYRMYNSNLEQKGDQLYLNRQFSEAADYYAKASLVDKMRNACLADELQKMLDKYDVVLERLDLEDTLMTITVENNSKDLTDYVLRSIFNGFTVTYSEKVNSESVDTKYAIGKIITDDTSLLARDYYKKEISTSSYQGKGGEIKNDSSSSHGSSNSSSSSSSHNETVACKLVVEYMYDMYDFYDWLYGENSGDLFTDNVRLDAAYEFDISVDQVIKCWNNPSYH